MVALRGSLRQFGVVKVLLKVSKMDAVSPYLYLVYRTAPVIRGFINAGTTFFVKFTIMNSALLFR